MNLLMSSTGQHESSAANAACCVSFLDLVISALAHPQYWKVKQCDQGNIADFHFDWIKLAMEQWIDKIYYC